MDEQYDPLLVQEAAIILGERAAESFQLLIEADGDAFADVYDCWLRADGTIGAREWKMTHTEPEYLAQYERAIAAYRGKTDE